MSVITADPAAPNPGQGTPPGNGTPQGNQPADWRAGLPEDLRSEKVFESIKGKDWTEAGPVLAKNYINAQRMVGADKLVVPGPQATPEELNAFYDKLGRPPTPDKYSYKLPDGVKPEQLNKEVLDGWLKEMHEAGVPAKVADRIMTKYLADEFKAHQAGKQAAAKQQETWELGLKEKWAGKFDENLNYAKWALKEFSDKEGTLSKFLDDSGLGSHPDVLEFFAKVGRTLSDDKARGNGPGPRFNSGIPNNPAEAQAALNLFNNDQEKQKALFDSRHAQHDSVVKEREALFRAAFPKAEAAE